MAKFAHYRDTDALKREHYNNVDRLAARIALHERFSTATQPIHQWFFDLLLQHASPDQALDVLELGAGRGDIWKKNADQIPADWRIQLTDVSAGMLSDCRAYLGSLQSRFHFDVADIQHIPAPDNTYDVVIANMMLYHVPDLPRALAEVRRVLRPDGVFVAMTNGNEHMRELFDLAQRFDPDSADYPQVFHDSFSMQNGAGSLKMQFSDVVAYSFENALKVTEVQPMLDYIASMVSRPGEIITSTSGEQLTAEIEGVIARDGHYFIRKDTGVFFAKGLATA